MSVENKDVIDFISVKSNKVYLTISDHLKWSDENHLLLLQDKINAYLDIIENRQIYEVYPDSIGKTFVIQVVTKYKPTKKVEVVLNEIKAYLYKSNYEFIFHQLK